MSGVDFAELVVNQEAEILDFQRRFRLPVRNFSSLIHQRWTGPAA